MLIAVKGTSLNKILVMFMFSLAGLTMLPNLAFSETFFPIQIVELLPEARVSEEEMDAWNRAFPDFEKSEEALLKAYRNCMEEIGPGGQGWLSMIQSDWNKARLEKAYENSSPKGGPAYIQSLNKDAEERTAWLNNLAKKGSAVWVNNYLYAQPGYEGMVILYYRDDGMELELYTKSKAGAVCRAEGVAKSAQGKAVYNVGGASFEVEMLGLGKELDLKAGSESGICQGGGKFTGLYEIFK